ncbi:hypothetical protein pb186bvf_015538 [Paramecium bursaria]
MIIDSRSPKYISVPVIIKSEPARIIRYLPVQRLQTPLRDSQNTSLTLSLTNDKNVSHSTELSHLSTFYQSTEAEVKKFSWDTFRNSVQQLKQQAKENNFPLTKINSFHLGNKYRSNKIQRTSKPVITSKENLQLISHPEHQKSPETRRKSNSIMVLFTLPRLKTWMQSILIGEIQIKVSSIQQIVIHLCQPNKEVNSTQNTNRQCYWQYQVI